MLKKNDCRLVCFVLLAQVISLSTYAMQPRVGRQVINRVYPILSSRHHQWSRSNSTTDEKKGLQEWLQQNKKALAVGVGIGTTAAWYNREKAANLWASRSQGRLHTRLRQLEYDPNNRNSTLALPMEQMERAENLNPKPWLQKIFGGARPSGSHTKSHASNGTLHLKKLKKIESGWKNQDTWEVAEKTAQDIYLWWKSVKNENSRQALEAVIPFSIRFAHAGGQYVKQAMTMLEWAKDQKHEDEELSKIYNQLAATHYVLQDYDKAIAYRHKALKLHETGDIYTGLV